MEITNGTKAYKSSHYIVYSCQYHIIFCPKYRRKVLIDGVDVRLKELLIEKESEYGYEVMEMEIMAEHVHLILDINPQIGVVNVIGKIKGLQQPILLEKSSLGSRSVSLAYGPGASSYQQLVQSLWMS